MTKTGYPGCSDNDAVPCEHRPTKLNHRCGFSSHPLQHWHSDHSGGILKALELLNEGRAATGNQSTIIVDVHPDRPEARGIWPPGGQAPTGRLPADPTFDELKRAGAEVETHAEPHLVGNGTMFVSGQIARRTKFETGIVGGCQWVDGRWVKGIGNPGSLIMDERYLAVDVKDKGLVVFSSCSRKSGTRIP